MALTKQEWLALEKKAFELRNLCLDTTYWAGSGHIGGGMSVMDMLTILYHKYLNIKKDDPNWEDRDRFILSKGHSGIAYAPVLCDFGYNDPEQLKTFNLTNSKMGIHLDSNKVVGVDASTGSLGHGLSIALGTALAARVLGKDYKTYCILGDGECDDPECACHHHHHHADEVFTSWGAETPKQFTQADIDRILTALDSGEYGAILRAKGIVPAADGQWLHFDYVPQEHEVRYGAADYTGRLCVIGAQLKEDKLKELFSL